MGYPQKSWRKLVACNVAFIAVSTVCLNEAVNIYVATAGNDSNPGSLDRPVAILAAAQKLVRSSTGRRPVTAWLRDPKAARSPLFNYDHVQNLDKIDRAPGLIGENFPANCLVEDCLIYLTGRVEKQTAGVEIDLAQDITVRHCSIYDLPRAGINIGDGCWGGHVIEWCDIFDTVKETGDHGSFNSWRRDRFWRPNIGEVNARVKQAPELPLLDVVP